MSNQKPNQEHRAFKIIFSKIKCKINLTDSSLFALVARIGKLSSRYTQKKQLINSGLQFNDILQVPCDQKLMFNQNSKKQKCQIMLYKFKLNRQKQTKQLVGMASIGISNQMFDEIPKKIRLTNSFDKEAYIQCSVRIQIGQADILSLNDSKISSFFIKSEQNSFSDIQDMKNQINGNLIRSQVKYDSNVGKINGNSSGKGMFGQIKRQNTDEFSYIPTNQRNNDYIGAMAVLDESMNKQLKFTQSREQQQLYPKIAFNNAMGGNENNYFMQICTNLQNQNHDLMQKIQNLQGQIFQNKFQAEYQALNNSRSLADSSISRRSPMIKKNLKLKIAPVTIPSKLYSKQSVSTNLTNEVQAKKNIQQLKLVGSQLRTPHFFPNSQKNKNIDNIQQLQNQNKESPKIPKIIKNKNSQNQCQNLSLNGTFAWGNSSAKFNSLSINKVLAVTYKPDVQSSDLSYIQQSITNHSISKIEREGYKYQKFSKHKIGVVEKVNGDDSKLLALLEQDNKSQKKQSNRKSSLSLKKSSESGSIEKKKSLRQKSNQFRQMSMDQPNIYINTESKQNKQSKQKRQSIQKKQKVEEQQDKCIKQNGQNKQNKQEQQDRWSKQNKQNKSDKYEKQQSGRVTLQQLNIQTQIRYRNNERILKMANQQLMIQNTTMRDKKKTIEEQVSQYRQNSQQQLRKMKLKVIQLEKKIVQHTSQKTQYEQQILKLKEGYDTQKKETDRLRRNLNQQKILYHDYLKLSRINDDIQKDIEQKNISTEPKNVKVSQKSQNGSMKDLNIKPTNKSVFIKGENAMAVQPNQRSINLGQFQKGHKQKNAYKNNGPIDSNDTSRNSIDRVIPSNKVVQNGNYSQIYSARNVDGYTKRGTIKDQFVPQLTEQNLEHQSSSKAISMLKHHTSSNTSKPKTINPSLTSSSHKSIKSRPGGTLIGTGDTIIRQYTKSVL